MNTVNYEQVLHRIAVYCSRTERCINDIRRKMNRLRLSDEEQQQIIDYLQKEKFIDEQRFCRAYVNDKSKHNQWGAHKISYELKKKQIPEAFIKEALSEINPENTLEQLRCLLAKKKKTIKGINDYEINQKLLCFATRKGFRIEDIEKVFNI